MAPPHVRGEPTDPGLNEKIPPGTRIFHVPYPDQLWSRIMARAFWAETWLPRAWPGVKSAVADFKPDVVLTTSPPGCVHWLGFLAQRKLGVRWVADMRDPWVTNVSRYMGSPVHKAINGFGEKAMIRNADLIVANTPGTLRGLQRSFPEASAKLAMVTNGFDPLPVIGAPVRRSNADAVTLLHAGEFYAGRDPRPLMRVLGELERSRPAGVPRFRLRLLGRLDGDIDVTGTIREHGLQRIIDAPGQVSHAQVQTALAEADVLLSVQSSSYPDSIPAKLYEYLAFDKPILQLAAPGSDMDWVLQTSGVLHRVVDQADEAGIRRALLELASAIADGKATASDPARMRTFTREATIGQLAGHLDRLLETRSRVEAAG